MKIRKALILGIVASLMAVPPAYARRGNDQGEAREDMQKGNTRSLREIESGVLPRMRGMQYLGPEYDSIAQVYRLKFIDNGRVIFVDVDARSGRILRQR